MSFRSGIVALVGRPNVGKSTLLNRLVGQKVSITSRRPQTTRHRIIGIKTASGYQIIYVDTPGLHTQGKKRINRYLNRAASGSLLGVDCAVMMIAASGWVDQDRAVLDAVRDQHVPVILAINKIDTLDSRSPLLPLIEQSSRDMNLEFAEIIPLSARSGEHVAELEQAILPYLPEQPALYPEDQITDRSERFLAAELVREQVFRSVGDEVPYSAAVAIEGFTRESKLLRIDAVIWVEKEGQKRILIGKQGTRLKGIGTQARLALEEQFGCRVYLGLWVKVRENWTDDERALRSFGFGEEG